jgi:PAS domain S-box-containing protein
MEANELKILAIDDNRDNLTILKAVLMDRLPAAKVLVALDGAQGLDLAYAYDPDLILLDIVMPGMDGYVVCRKLKMDRRLHMIPVVFLTALRTDCDSRIKALEAGAEGFLSKPFDEAELVAQILAMAKIKAANRSRMLEKERLAALVSERTAELEKELRERRRAEDALRESNTRFLSLADNLPGYMAYIDARTLCYEFVNAAVERTFGIPRERIIGMHIKELTGEDHYRFALRYIDEARSGKASSYEKSIDLASGRRWVQVNYTPVFDPEGRVVSLVLLSYDISERKRAEEEKARLQNQLYQAQKMEAIGLLAGGIAHDFNNILAAIIGYAEMVRDGARSEVYGNIAQVLTSANRAKELVRQILSFSRQSPENRYPVQMQSQVKEVLKMLRASIPSTIRISEHIDHRCGAILADPTQISQITMNLCSNAYHAMEKTGGVMTVALAPVAITGKEASAAGNLAPGDYVELAVSDTGVGIEPEIADRIFDPYFTTKEVGEGTGLGLSITQGIIKNYDGTIRVESASGQGTTFRVYLPCIREAVSASASSQEVPHGKGRILFVDDEVVLSNMGKAILERLGYTVSACTSSSDALTVFSEAPTQFDLVITDQTMPGMTGIVLARRMLDIRPDLPIILCTGFSTQVNEQSAKAMGIREFALKPLSKTLISQLVKKVLAPEAEGNVPIS